MSQDYSTRAGDTVDLITYRQYGVADASYVVMVLEANPGLAEYGPVLPAGLIVSLPDYTPATEVKDAVTLWS